MPKNEKSNNAERRSRNSALTRQELLAAAALRFSKYGYDDTGVNDIAGDVNVDAALIYRYFGSKSAMFEAAFAEHPPRSWQDAPPEEIPLGLLRSILATSGPTSTSMVGLLRSITNEGVAGLLRERLNEHSTLPMARGLIGSDPALRADLITAVVMGIELLRNVVHKEPISSADPDLIISYFERVVAALRQEPDEA